MEAFDQNLDTLRIGFVGAGRLGTALAWSIARRGLRVGAAFSQVRADTRRLADPIPGCTIASTMQAVVNTSDIVFITTPDAVIEAATAQAGWRPGVAAVHCSGVTEVSALDHAARDGAMTGGFHPMQTFGDPEAAARSLPGCTVTIEADEPLNTTLVALARRLECQVNRLPRGMRGRYHAAAGYPSQFINALFAEAASIWQSWGASREDAVRALLPLARGTLASIEAAGIARGMPGPVSRGDIESIEKHVAALTPLGPDVIEFYRVVCGRTIPLGVERGAIDEDAARRLRGILAR
ncbi:MAG: DUF2520 domain-containing protein [Betaproteobacteria bacterium]|nr:DUF2520 domain-containing protein [Betaproteobacteria bacterium]MDE2208677.1 DUF2520 domain-containing protein [Betaproteobacteria bacterium]